MASLSNIAGLWLKRCSLLLGTWPWAGLGQGILAGCGRVRYGGGSEHGLQSSGEMEAPLSVSLACDGWMPNRQIQTLRKHRTDHVGCGRSG